jgi:type VI secretion system protein ImpA
MNPSNSLSCSDYYQHVMQPLAGEAPCGENLDYDPAFIMLQSRLQPKLGVEYGNFVEAAEPVNWTDTERECLELLEKSKDIRLIVTLIRCRLRKVGLAALAEGTEVLLALLRAWPDELHPQLLDEGEFAPMLRANAFAELEDINGLLADLRNQPLPKASGLQITLKEFEKAHQIPREEGALSDTAVAALVHEWHFSAQEGIRPLTQSYHFLREIKQTLAESLGHEAPELATLQNILAMFSSKFDSETSEVLPPQQAQPQIQSDESLYSPAAASSTAAVAGGNISSSPLPLYSTPEVKAGVNSRADAIKHLQEIRRWFTASEPSSPLVHVLKYAEDSIGKSFAELLKMYPPEIIAMLNQEKE